MATVQDEYLERHLTPEEWKARQNEKNRETLKKIASDLEVAKSYVCDRDRPVEEIEAEHGLPRGGLGLVLQRLQPYGLRPDR